jgi:hypothetical protein
MMLFKIKVKATPPPCELILYGCDGIFEARLVVTSRSQEQLFDVKAPSPTIHDQQRVMSHILTLTRRMR